MDRPFRKLGARVPVYLMRQMVKAFVGRSPGISIYTSTSECRVTILMNTPEETFALYRAIAAIDPVR